MPPVERDYRVTGRGSDLAIDARGADPAACLAAVVAGFAASLAEVPADAPRERLLVRISTERGEELLVELVEELIVATDAEGLLAVDLDATVTAGAVDREGEGPWSLDGALETVPLDELEIHGAAPKAATWHDVRFEPVDDGWRASIMVDI